MTTVRTVLKNSVWLLIANLALKIISVIIIAIIARKLGSDVFGQYAFALAFVSFFSIISDFGINPVIVRDIARNPQLTKKYLGNIAALKIGLSFVVVILVWLSSAFLQQSPTVKLAIVILGFELVISGFSDMLTSFFQAQQQMKFEAFRRISEKVLWAASIIISIQFGLDLIRICLLMVLADIFGLILMVLIMNSKIMKVRFDYDPKFWKNILWEAAPFAMTGLFVLVYFKIDMVMLGFMQNDQVVGWYAAAYKVIDMLVILPSILMTSLYPAMSRIYRPKEEKFLYGFSLSFRYLTILAAPVVAGLYVFSDVGIEFVFGSQYVGAVPALKILAFAVFFSYVNYPLVTFLNTIGKQKVAMITTGIAAAINIVLNLVLIPRYSYLGASLATVASELVFFTLSYIFIKRYYPQFRGLTIFPKPAIAACIMGFIGFMLNFRIPWSISILVCIVTYFSLLLLLGEFKVIDGEIIKKIFLRKE